MSDDEPVDKNNLASVIEWVARKQARAVFSERIETIEKEILGLKKELQSIKELLERKNQS